MSTVAKLTAAVQRLQHTYITKGKAARFACGVAALSLEAFESLNAAGRSLGVNRFTGENRIRRTVTDNDLTDRLQQLLVASAVVSKGSVYGQNGVLVLLARPFPVRPVLYCHTGSIQSSGPSYPCMGASEPK